MSKKRRRLLMIATRPKIFEGECTTCLSCGYSEEPEYIDGSYQRSEYVAFCKSCQKHSRHYYCTTTDAGGSISCNLKWCSVCGCPAECENCGSNQVYPASGPCINNVCDMSFYMCSNCGTKYGDDGSDHVDCEDEGGESSAGDCFTCPTCSYENTSYYGSGYCRQCGFANLVRCTNTIDGAYCLQTFCSKCGEFNPLFQCTSCDYYSWLTEPDTLSTDLTCQYCEQGNGEGDNAFAHECPRCGTLHCVECGEPLE